MLGTHRTAADATQIHDHYLKGTLFCGQCGSRLLVEGQERPGVIYPYLCASRHGGRGDCTRQAMMIEHIEHLVERLYDHVQIDSETRQALSSMLHTKFDQMMSEGAVELADLASRRTQLEGEQEKLLQAHYAGAIPLDLLKREQDRITSSLETIAHRIAAHHGQYAEARANLDDSLELLSNASDIYANADNANRRLCNQALFKAIYVDEDNDIRVAYQKPYTAVGDAVLQADALTWAATARRAGQVGTSSKGGPLVESSNLAAVGCLSSTFGNSAPKTKTLVNRLDRGVYEVSRRPQNTAPKDDRGPVVRTVETAQTFLTASEVDALVGDYLAGMSVKALAERYGIHRATVFAHLRRRNVPSRRQGSGSTRRPRPCGSPVRVSRCERSVVGWAWTARQCVQLWSRLASSRTRSSTACRESGWWSGSARGRIKVRMSVVHRRLGLTVRERLDRR